MNQLQQNWAELPTLLSWHMLLSLGAIATAAVIAGVTALLVDRRPRLQSVSLSVAGITQTIPGLALLALMVPLLGGTIGFLPAYLALTVYAVLPLLQNTVTGLAGVDPRVIEAARGLGMAERQILFRVRFPLALPVILAGLRTSTVWTVGMTTLATAVGASGLGTYIFSGLQTRNHAMTLFGCFFAAALAVVLDQALRLVEHGVRTRRRGLVGAAGAAVAAAFLVASAGALLPTARAFFDERSKAAPVQSAEATEAASPERPGLPLAGMHLTTGSKTFVESHLLAEVVGLHLEAAGATVENRPGMGSTILFDALRENSVDCYVDYSGTVWATLMRRSDPASRLRTQIEAAGFLLSEHDVVTVGPLGFQNNYAVAMRPERAEELGVRSVADLAGHRLTIGGDPEVFSRPEWTRVRGIYGLEMVTPRPMQAIYMFDAVTNGQVDAITAYSTDGRLADSNLVLLDDPLEGFPPYDAILLASPEASRNPRLMEVLTGLVNRIDNGAMRQANRLVEVDRQTPLDAAQWLWESTR